MALVFVDGFDDGLTLKGKWKVRPTWGFLSDPAHASFVAARNGNGLRLAPNGWMGQETNRTVGKHSPGNRVGFGCAFLTDVAPGAATRLLYSATWLPNESNNRTVQIYLQPDLTLDVRAESTVVGTTTTALTLNTFYYIELIHTRHVTGSATAADNNNPTFTLRINGEVVLQNVGVEDPAAALGHEFYLYGPEGNAAVGSGHVYDDLYMIDGSGDDNNALLGQVAIETHYPNAAGTYAEFTPSDAMQANHALVDEPGDPVTTDYITTDQKNARDLYGFSNLVQNQGEVLGVQVSAHGQKTSGDPMHVKMGMRHNGNEDRTYHGDLAQNEWNGFSRIFERTPDGEIWTPARFDAAEFGVFSALADSWMDQAPMPTARAYGNHKVGVVANKAYVIGGWDGGVRAENESYDPVSDTWTTKAALTTARSNNAVVGVNGLVHTMGGHNSTVDTENLAYDPAVNTYATRAALTEARNYASASEVEGIVYLMGGMSTTAQVLNQAYDPVANTWTKKAAIPTGRYAAAAVVIDGIIYLIGGGGPAGSNIANEAYDPLTNTWATKAVMPTGRAYIGHGALHGRAHIVGGYTGAFLDAHEVYDPVSDTWTTRAALLAGRDGQFSFAWGGRLFLFGGGSPNNGMHAENEVYEPL